MIKHVLCATDFSDFSKNAMDYALHFARAIDAHLTVLHVSQPQSFLAHSPGDLMEKIWKEHEREVVDRINEQLDGIMAEEKDLHSVIINREVRSGLVVDGINLAAEELDADLIVVGMHGASGIKDLLFGNHTAGIISRSGKPLLIVPGTVRYQPVKRIGYAVDFTDFDHEDLNTLLAVKEQLAANLRIVHVDVEHGAASSEQISNFTQMVSELLGVEDVKYDFLEGDEPIVALSNYTESGASDLLAIRHQHRNFLARILGKSISKTMADITAVPLLVFKE